MTAMLSRTKKLPDLQRLLIGAQHQRPARQSVAAMKGVVTMLSQMYGGRVQRGKGARRG